MRIESLERRSMMAANPIGMTQLDTGEFLLGSVAVTPVFFESNGDIDQETQDWVAADINATIAKITEGVNWWSDTLDTLDTVHELDFTFDFTHALHPVETPYELIDRKSQDFELAVADWMDSLGYSGSSSVQTAVQQFNHDQRIKLGTDWAFTIFVIDSSDDPVLGDAIEDPDDPDDNDGFFPADGYFRGAFAYAGGLFMVTPSSRPAATIAHEMGHIFWTRDEYPGGGSWYDQRGYYNTQNTNAADDAPVGYEQEISIMRSGIPLNEAYDLHVSPDSTLAMLGWQDSDGDGIFDLADVPLDFDGVGYFDRATSIYHFSGAASAVPLKNENSVGPQSDITLNRISELQYRLDEGDWISAAVPDSARADFDLELSIDTPFERIDWRVVDSEVGVTSELVSGGVNTPAISASRIAGYTYFDENNNQLRDFNEPLLAGVTASIEYADGSEILQSSVAAVDLPTGKIDPQQTDGLTLSTDSFGLDPVVYVEPSLLASGENLFQSYSFQHSSLREHWNAENKLKATFDQPVGYVELDIVAGSEPSYGRIEAYDAAGNLVGRQTSDDIPLGSSVPLRFEDPTAQIASIRVFGHAGTSIGIKSIDFGSVNQITTDQSGAWYFGQLADGDYRIRMTASDDSFELEMPTFLVTVDNSSAALLSVPVRERTNSWHNANVPGDVNGDNLVTAGDALVVINYLTDQGARQLDGIAPEKELVDVNNDGLVTALDAVIVINALTPNASAGDGERVIEIENQTTSNRQSSIAPQPAQREATDQAFADWPSVSLPEPEKLDIRYSSGPLPILPLTNRHRSEISKNFSKKTVVDQILGSTIDMDLSLNDDLAEKVEQLIEAKIDLSIDFRRN
ncbi:Dockerin type I repeat protein [Novipirellula aureliae]|uniref:Dockerin type I repeat protein n=2 Tax=Novipirellula aureliae TaxID=2527966 RepID=A0A5C6ECV5_9BACT|nr:Dockerin type I repeat protein [Novipirellula aureliae]